MLTRLDDKVDLDVLLIGIACLCGVSVGQGMVGSPGVPNGENISCIVPM